ANMEFLAGIRYDIHNIYENVLNWRVAAVYPFTDKIYTKILYGTSFKAPSSTQLYTNYIRTEGVIGNPDLDPEKVRTLEWALGGQFIRNVSLNITAFYNNIKKVELVLPKGTVLNVQAENISEINSIGGESELIFSYDMLMSYVNYSFQWSILTKEHPMRGDIKIETDLYPLHMAKFGINYKIPEIFINLNCEGRYIHSRVASEPNSQVYDPVNYLTDKYSLGAYFLLDVMISTYNLKLTGDKETEIRVKVYNVLGTEYVFPGFNGFDIPGFERTFVVSLIQKF
ncbi:MAG: TonB-dependent receptor, partial [bacterium]|nr:TonB-dependent receptor [bacterium]